MSLPVIVLLNAVLDAAVIAGLFRLLLPAHYATR